MHVLKKKSTNLIFLNIKILKLCAEMSRRENEHYNRTSKNICYKLCRQARTSVV